LTRLIDRMEAAGLVKRQACPGDRRAIHIVLTPQGLSTRQAAWPRYAELINLHFARYLSSAEAAQLGDSLFKVVGGERLRRRCPAAE
jgi:DNA-binding MarR family transcriptional regulator